MKVDSPFYSFTVSIYIFLSHIFVQASSLATNNKYGAKMQFLPNFFFFLIIIYLFGCVGSSFMCEGFL